MSCLDGLATALVCFGGEGLAGVVAVVRFSNGRRFYGGVVKPCKAGS
jgi:hypothetical protein